MSRMLRMTEAQLARRKPSKYRNVKKTVDGIAFDSTKEARIYQDLKIREHAGEIADLKLQPKIVCQANGVHICDYKADFLYFDRKLDEYVWLDAKGFRTPVYRLKRKIVLALTGIAITEV